MGLVIVRARERIVKKRVPAGRPARSRAPRVTAMTHRLRPIAAQRLFALLACVGLLFGAQSAAAALIGLDFNDFYADPSVTVAPDGSAALLAEDAGLSFVLLANDPFFGDPAIIVPGLGTRLLFDYAFYEAAGQDDQF